MSRLIPTFRLLGLAGILATLSTVCFAQSNEALQQQVDELTRRVDALEKQVTSSRSPAPAAPAAGKDPGQAEALALYGSIDELLGAGKIPEAKQALVDFKAEYAGSKAIAWTGSLDRELAVVGKAAPENWAIEKWFQGQSDIDLDGSKATVVIFWETWCPHCKNEVPKLQKIYDDYRGRGLQVLGLTRLTRSATEESVQSFIDERGVSYPIAKETGEIAGYFSVKGIPAAALVKDGKIVWRGHPTRLTDDLLGRWL